jgi:hypothetical protein
VIRAESVCASKGVASSRSKARLAAGELDSGGMDVFSVTALLGIGVSSRIGSEARKFAFPHVPGCL